MQGLAVNHKFCDRHPKPNMENLFFIVSPALSVTGKTARLTVVPCCGFLKLSCQRKKERFTRNVIWPDAGKPL